MPTLQARSDAGQESEEAVSDHDELTPQAELERGQRLVTEGIAMQVKAQMRLGLATAEWVDQHTSPLGRRPHLELARTGKVESKKLHGRVLIRKSDLDAHIERNALTRGTKHDEDDVGDVLERITGTGKR